jgi:hypothetical protein
MKQPDLFAGNPADLPLFSGTPQRAQDEQFTPSPAGPKQLTFKEWMQEVDRACIDVLGVGTPDLPDMLFADWYKLGYQAQDAIDNILENLRDM